MVGMGGGARSSVLFLCVFFAFVFFKSFWVQVWERGPEDAWWYVDTAWWPYEELMSWKRNNYGDEAYCYDWEHSWEVRGEVE